LVGAFLGAATAALFFFMVARRVTLMSRRSEIDQGDDDERASRFHDRISTIGRSAAFVAGITGVAFLFVYSICPSNFPFANGCEVSVNTSIWVGAFLGAVTTALFFYLIEKRVSTALEDYARAYIVRTCFFNLKDVFAPNKVRGERRLIPNEVNRQYFLKILNEQYLLEFDAKEGDIVRDIYRLASNHGEIVEDAHDYEKCPVCRNDEGLVRQLKRYLDKNPNPIEKGVQKYPRDTPTGRIQESR